MGYLEERDKERLKARLLRRLVKLGVKVRVGEEVALMSGGPMSAKERLLR